MTTALDAYAVLALLKGEPASGQVRTLIDAGGATLTVLGVAEVVDHLVRIVGVDEEDAALDLAQLGLTDPDPLGAQLTLRAGLLRARHYHRTDRSVSLADCVLAEVARALSTSVATSDLHLLDVCDDEGIAVSPLPDSLGHTWSR
ncbi:MAG: PIN domain-containing protein [Acidimicrobiia bacterium]|nr:PIN domain-containing protein [Acidimicrobiia bacterium]